MGSQPPAIIAHTLCLSSCTRCPASLPVAADPARCASHAAPCCAGTTAHLRQVIPRLLDLLVHLAVLVDVAVLQPGMLTFGYLSHATACCAQPSGWQLKLGGWLALSSAVKDLTLLAMPPTTSTAGTYALSSTAAAAWWHGEASGGRRSCSKQHCWAACGLPGRATSRRHTRMGGMPVNHPQPHSCRCAQSCGPGGCRSTGPHHTPLGPVNQKQPGMLQNCWASASLPACLRQSTSMHAKASQPATSATSASNLVGWESQHHAAQTA